MRVSIQRADSSVKVLIFNSSFTFRLQRGLWIREAGMKERKGMRSRELLPPVTRRLGPDDLPPWRVVGRETD